MNDRDTPTDARPEHCTGHRGSVPAGWDSGDYYNALVATGSDHPEIPDDNLPDTYPRAAWVGSVAMSDNPSDSKNQTPASDRAEGSHSEDRPATSGGGGGSDKPPKGPEDRTGNADEGDESSGQPEHVPPEPTLGFGDIIHYPIDDPAITPMLDLGQESAATDGFSDRASAITDEDEYNTHEPAVTMPESGIEVSSDDTVIARPSSDHPLVLSAETRDGCVITIQHPGTGEICMINVSPSAVGTELSIQLTDSALESVAAFRDPDVSVHIFGGTQEIISAEGVTRSYAEGLADYLRVTFGLGEQNITIPHEAIGEIDILMKDGALPEAWVNGIRAYPSASPEQGHEAPGTSDTASDNAENPRTDRPTVDLSPERIMSQTDEHINSPPTVLALVADIAPYGQQRIEAIRSVISAAIQNYNNREQPSSPEERTDFFNGLLPNGRDGMEALSYMIQQHHHLLPEITGTKAGEADDRLLLDMLVDKIDTRQCELDGHIARLEQDIHQTVDEGTSEEKSLRLQALLRERDWLGAKLEQAFRIFGRENDRRMRIPDA